MHSISLTDDTYQALVDQAAARHVDVEEIVRQGVELLSHQMPGESAEPTKEQRLQALDRLAHRADERADLYPPGFRVDDSREAMYEDRLRAQL